MPFNPNHFAWASPVAIVAAFAAAPAWAAPDAVVDFNIAPQPMQGALNALSAQSGVRLLYPYDRVSGLASPGVRGRMATREALDQIIAGSSLRVAMTQKDLIALTAAGQPSAGLIRTARPRDQPSHLRPSPRRTPAAAARPPQRPSRRISRPWS